MLLPSPRLFLIDDGGHFSEDVNYQRRFAPTLSTIDRNHRPRSSETAPGLSRGSWPRHGLRTAAGHARHRSLPHGGSRRARGPMRPLRASQDQLQLLRQSPLQQVSIPGSGQMAGKAQRPALAHTLHGSKSVRITPQTADLEGSSPPNAAKPQSFRPLKTKFTTSTPLAISPRTVPNRRFSFLD